MTEGVTTHPEKQKTVLLIDDDPQFVEEVSAVLEGEGFRVKAAYDGEAGLELATNVRPALVLLDLVLPKLFGFAVLKEMKRNRQTSSIPVVVLTNLETPENVNRALSLGARAYLLKANQSP